ncbi:hypothetical protein NDU88_008551 [Pleurodeles waltl]|uniref:Uncharacterized protein n=1 Tax=Pleurodeles waltl TaxID=8319 RepID=A0AAV7PT77_PLEWA|nr:hypothetical protein NDU88_008551 [Pleurodeles waltl]
MLLAGGSPTGVSGARRCFWGARSGRPRNVFRAAERLGWRPGPRGGASLRRLPGPFIEGIGAPEGSRWAP